MRSRQSHNGQEQKKRYENELYCCTIPPDTREEKAISLKQQRCLKKRGEVIKKILGRKHKETLRSMGMIGLAYSLKGQ